VYGIRRGMSNGELENLWVSEKHDTATGKKLFIDMITNVNELSNRGARLLKPPCVCCFFLIRLVFVFLLLFLLLGTRTGENHDTAKGRKLLVNILTDVDELSNVLMEDTSEDTSPAVKAFYFYILQYLANILY
jgi:hypothetical protein